MEYIGELACVHQSRGIRTVGFHLHGVERAGGAEGQEIKEDGLILLKAPLPDVGGRAGDTLAPILAGCFEALESGRTFHALQRLHRRRKLQGGVVAMAKHIEHQSVNDGGKAFVRRIQQACRKSRRLVGGQALDE